MYSPLKIRKLEEFRDVEKIPEIQQLRRESDEILRKIQQLRKAAENAWTAVPKKVRTDFLPYGSDCFVSWDLSFLPDDGRIPPPFYGGRTYITADSMGDLWMHTTPERYGGVPLSARSKEDAIHSVTKTMREGGWVFVGAEYDGDKVRITDWRELS